MKYIMLVLLIIGLMALVYAFNGQGATTARIFLRELIRAIF